MPLLLAGCAPSVQGWEALGQVAAIEQVDQDQTLERDALVVGDAVRIALHLDPEVACDEDCSAAFEGLEIDAGAWRFGGERRGALNLGAESWQLWVLTAMEGEVTVDQSPVTDGELHVSAPTPMGRNGLGVPDADGTGDWRVTISVPDLELDFTVALDTVNPS